MTALFNPPMAAAEMRGLLAFQDFDDVRSMWFDHAVNWPEMMWPEMMWRGERMWTLDVPHADLGRVGGSAAEAVRPLIDLQERAATLAAELASASLACIDPWLNFGHSLDRHQHSRKRISVQRRLPPPGVTFLAEKPEKVDDLTAIKGIGPKLASILNAIGIWSFEQIARLSDEEARFVDEKIEFPGRVRREDWAGQAKALISGA